MKNTNQFLAGSALYLMMMAPIGAQADGGLAPANGGEAPLMLAQEEAPAEPEAGEAPAGAAECPPGTAPVDGECAAVEEEAPAEEEAPVEEAPVEEAPVEEAPVEEAPAEEAPAEEAPAEEAPVEEAPVQEAPVEEAPVEEAPAEEAPAEEAPVEEEPPAEMQPAEPEAAPSAEPEAEMPAEEAPEAEEPAAEEPVEEEPAAEEPAAEEPADGGEAPEEAPVEAAPEDEAPAMEEAPADAGEAEEPEATEEAPAEEAPEAGECPPNAEMTEAGGCVVIDEDVPLEEQPAEEAPAEEAPAEEAAPAEPEEAPVDEEAEAGEEEVSPEDAAPVLDSQKETTGEGEEQPVEGEEPAEQAEEPVDDAEEPAEQAEEPADEAPEQQAEEAPVPESDEQAQEELVDPQQVQEAIRALVEEEGQPIELGDTPEDIRVQRAELYQRREEVRVVEEYNDNRTIVEINNNIYVQSPDYDRIALQDDQVYYEELRGERVREVIERADGTRVITVRNRYGDVIRRVRVLPDGREYVLVYVPEERYDEVLSFEDPTYGLPPLRLTIPASEYVLEADQVEDPDRYYTFLQQPPVEPVRRLYSLEEVKYSARVRDTVRRIDLDTIEFEFGSARIEESEIADLEAVAEAMLRMLEENPAETFLIEGHTDAVGSETANLALSDRRAEAVAVGLTNVFGVPPENLVTQGYGEQYLKVATQEPERENRRVAIRRITPLVTPVARQQ
ncbi:OmpA family protein [Chelativorans salis]|uniref:OmpA family protein n=1 Tax=Chelativorans salis TaxID=2978478 RepID=A0ABT2LKN2_9HYPH|nr:OmpA family protein [Chelativorans sp. EGI FJ00035]MCT7374934.1 OmpA family protein [Chelativorans sp. EGI FJ00035]